MAESTNLVEVLQGGKTTTRNHLTSSILAVLFLVFLQSLRLNIKVPGLSPKLVFKSDPICVGTCELSLNSVP